MKGGAVALAFGALLLLGGPTPAQSGGARLRPSKDYWFEDVKRVPVRFTRVGRGRKLAAVGDTLYMLDGRGRVVWSWSSGGAPLTDAPVVDAKGTIYVIGYDLLWAAVDAESGREKWRGTANGRALYSQIELYKGDMYLVVTDMSGYREDKRRARFVNDALTLCRGNSILWDTEIPAGSRIMVRGGQVFATYRRGRRQVVRRIEVPPRLDKPVGKVSALADFG